MGGREGRLLSVGGVGAGCSPFGFLDEQYIKAQSMLFNPSSRSVVGFRGTGDFSQLFVCISQHVEVRGQFSEVDSLLPPGGL